MLISLPNSSCCSIPPHLLLDRIRKKKTFWTIAPGWFAWLIFKAWLKCLSTCIPCVSQQNRITKSIQSIGRRIQWKSFSVYLKLWFGLKCLLRFTCHAQQLPLANLYWLFLVLLQAEWRSGSFLFLNTCFIFPLIRTSNLIYHPMSIALYWYAFLLMTITAANGTQ